VKTSHSSKTIAADGALAVQAARTAPGQIATLILPADTAWGESDGPVQVDEPAPRAAVSSQATADGVRALKNGKSATLFLGNAAVRGKALEWAGRIAAKTGCSLISESGNARIERGAGRAPVRQLPFVVDNALAMLKDTRQLVLVGSKSPVSFFAYPGKPSVLVPEGCEVIKVAGPEADLEGALETLAGELGARDAAPLANAPTYNSALPTGAITLESLGALLNQLIPDNAIVMDEAITSGRAFTLATMGARPHDWLSIMGGSIGWGLAAAVGGAIARRERQIVAAIGDGSALYASEALWTGAHYGTKMLLVVLFFMHVRYSSRLTWAVVAAGFFWLGLLLLLTLSDYVTRGPGWLRYG